METYILGIDLAKRSSSFMGPFAGARTALPRRCALPPWRRSANRVRAS